MTKKLCLNLRSGNKGFILSLDVAVAIFVVFIMLMISAFYVSRGNEEQLSKLQMSRTGADVMAILDYEKTLETLDQDEVASEIKTLLPPNYEMRIMINGTFPAQIMSVETTTQPPGEQLVVGGRREFVIRNATNEYFATAYYWIWLK